MQRSLKQLEKKIEALEARFAPRDEVRCLHTVDGEDSKLVIEEWRRAHPNERAPNIWVMIREFCGQPRPEFCTRRSVLRELPHVKAWVQDRLRYSGDSPKHVQEEANEDESYWRGLAARFELDYDSVVPERAPGAQWERWERH